MTWSASSSFLKRLRSCTLGATSSVEIGKRLEALLYDEEARGRLAERASRFVREHGMTSDGRAADRTATVILGES